MNCLDLSTLLLKAYNTIHNLCLNSKNETLHLHSKIKEMSYKLVCCDIDGTLLDANRELAAITIHEVQRIAPIPFILISSRMPKAMWHLQHQLTKTNTPIIAYNGALILDKTAVVHSTIIKNELLETIIKYCEKSLIHTSLYFEDEWYVPSIDYWAKREMNNTKVVPQIKSNFEVFENFQNQKKGVHKIMCMGDENEIEQLYQFLEKNFVKELNLYRSKATYIEISPKSISKKTGVEILLKKYYPTISMNDVVAFGDNFNDIEMLESVGMGIAVANATNEVLRIADRVTDTNKNNGVAKALKELF